jgi:hypothetical protein
LDERVGTYQHPNFFPNLIPAGAEMDLLLLFFYIFSNMSKIMGLPWSATESD